MSVFDAIGEMFGGTGTEVNQVQAPTIDMSQVAQYAKQGQQGRAQQGKAMGLAGGLATGTGPSAAQAMLEKQANDAQAKTNALAGSGYGQQGAGQARRAGLMAGAGAQAELGGSAGVARAAEQIGGIGMLGQQAGQQRGQDLGEAGIFGNLAAQQANLQAATNAQNIHAQEANAQQSWQALTSAAGAGAGMAMASSPEAKESVQSADNYDVRRQHAMLYRDPASLSSPPEAKTDVAANDVGAKPGGIRGAIGGALGGLANPQGTFDKAMSGHKSGAPGTAKAAVPGGPQESDADLARRRYEEDVRPDPIGVTQSMPDEYQEAFGSGKPHFGNYHQGEYVQPGKGGKSASFNDDYESEAMRAVSPHDEVRHMIAKHYFSPKDETTKLAGPVEEQQFQAWGKRLNLHDLNDPRAHYDYRGAYKAGLGPDSTGHWKDTYKQHGHPTFSDESQYAIGRDIDAGHWEGDTYMPPQPGLDMKAIAQAGRGGGNMMFGQETSGPTRPPTPGAEYRDIIRPAKEPREYLSQGLKQHLEDSRHNYERSQRERFALGSPQRPANADENQYDRLYPTPYLPALSSPPEAKTDVEGPHRPYELHHGRTGTQRGPALEGASGHFDPHSAPPVAEGLTDEADKLAWELHAEKMKTLRGLEPSTDIGREQLLKNRGTTSNMQTGFQDPRSGRVLDVLSREPGSYRRFEGGDRSGYAVTGSDKAYYKPEAYNPGEGAVEHRMGQAVMQYPSQEEVEQRTQQHMRETELPPLSHEPTADEQMVHESARPEQLSSPPGAKQDGSAGGVETALRALHPYSYSYKDPRNEPIPNPTGKERFFGIMTTDLKKHPVTRALVSGQGAGEKVSVPGATSLNLAASAHLQHGMDSHESRISALEGVLRKSKGKR